MYECPICGKSSNRRGDPFETKQQVIAHVDGSHDADHEDIRGQDVRGEIAEVSESRAQYGSEGASSDSSETADDSLSEQNRPSEQVSTTGRGDASDDTGRTAETESDPATEGRETVEITPDEIDQMIETAADEAYDAGYSDGQQETEPVEVESTVEDTEQTSKSGCPNCGGPAGLHEPGAKLVTADGRVLTTEHGDAYCENCHLIIGDGETHHLAKNPNPKAHKGGSTLGKIAAVAVAGLTILGLAATQQQNTNQSRSGSSTPEMWDDI